jgi:predicted RNase H-like nuclease
VGKQKASTFELVAIRAILAETVRSLQEASRVPARTRNAPVEIALEHLILAIEEIDASMLDKPL